jgi:hypothetical protein
MNPHPILRRLRRLIFVSMTLLVCSATTAQQTTIPTTLNYQGRIMQNGQPFDGTGHFVFGIYEGSTLLWTNKLPVPSPLNDPAAAIDSSDAKALTVRNGVFNVRLGEGDANNAPVGTQVFFKFDGTQRVRTDVKLAVWFSPDGGTFTRLNPDVDFTSVPYALVAGIAETVQDRSITTEKIASETVDALSSSLVQTAPVPTFTAMEDLAAFDAVAVVTDGSNNARLKKASAADGSRSAFYGFAKTAAAAGQPVAVHQYGPLAGFAGLATGQSYYVASANGTISTSGGVAPIYAGHALSSSLLFVDTFGVTKRWGTSNYWGDGSDGAMNTTGNVSLASVQDGDVVVKQYTSLTINAGHTLTTQTRCRGLVIYVNGDCTINGMLSMTARGANVDPAQTNSISADGIRLARKKLAFSETLSASDLGGNGAGGVGSAWKLAEANQPGIAGDGKVYVIAREGGSGAIGVSGGLGEFPGAIGGFIANGTGGGGAGGVVNRGTGGDGGRGTCYSGGAGGGGSANSFTYDKGGTGSSIGGAGGNAVTGAGGGAGNPGGVGSGAGTYGQNGTGGLLVLLVRGGLTIGSTGAITSQGSAGGAVYGGGAGGGRILILHAGSFSSSGAVSAAGGGNGGTGDITREQINP